MTTKTYKKDPINIKESNIDEVRLASDLGIREGVDLVSQTDQDAE